MPFVRGARHPALRPDDIEVTLRPKDEPLGPCQCSYFLGGCGG